MQADARSDTDDPAMETNLHLQDSVSNLKQHRIDFSETKNELVPTKFFFFD